MSLNSSSQYPTVTEINMPSGKPDKNRPTQTYWAQEQGPLNESIPLENRLELIRGFGDFSIAYSTAVQPKLEYFGDSSGYIAYRRRWGIVFGLGDPVAPKENHKELLSQFVAKFRKPTFVHLSEPTAAILSDLRIRVNEMGVDTNLDLESYNFNGKKKEWLRYADNWIRNHGYDIREAGFDEITAGQVEEISEAWRKTRTIKTKEVRFINRPIVVHDEPDVRIWCLFDSNQRLLAFIYFDPIYKDGDVIGYVTCIKRRHPDAPVYAEHAMMKRAIEQFQMEGRQVVKLGLSPLANIENKKYRCNRLMHHTSRYYHKAKWVNKYFYNFVGHTKYKKRFRGREEKIYYASPVYFNDFRLFCLGSLCGFF